LAGAAGAAGFAAGVVAVDAGVAGAPGVFAAVGLAAGVTGFVSALLSGLAAVCAGGVTSGLPSGLAGTGSDCTEPAGVDFTPPGVAGWSAVGFGSPDGGAGGDLGSSGIARERGKPPAYAAQQKNDNFYQLEV